GGSTPESADAGVKRLIEALRVRFPENELRRKPRYYRKFFKEQKFVGDMDKFLAAEIIKQKLPIRVSLSEEKADYIIVGNSIKKDGSNKWYHYFSGTAGLKDSVQASISLVEKKTESVVWAGNAGDRAIWWGALARGGERKASLRLVKALKKALKKR
ncbi:MAG: hypothetical protein QF437_28570, partial [Planctomycetota bacterium]|nr:hypothetical protein [Planctomycetota bacterium]